MSTIAAERLCEPDTPEWLEKRRGGIGASEAAAVLGLDEYKTPLHLYLDKRGESPDIEETDEMWLGHLQEPVVAKYFTRRTGIAVVQSPVGLFRHPEHDFVLATPDAILADGSLGEWKTTNFRMEDGLGDEGTDDIPERWLCQVQQQMGVMRIHSAYIAALIDGRRLKIYRVEFNGRLFEIIVEAERELWERIINGDPPEPDWNHSRTAQLVKEMRDSIFDTRVRMPADIAGMWERYERLGKLSSTIAKRRDELKARVTYWLGENYAGVLPDGRMVRRKKVNVSSYVVASREQMDIRAVKFDGGEVIDMESEGE
jgi:putative phage-type endonuclease